MAANENGDESEQSTMDSEQVDKNETIMTLDINWINPNSHASYKKSTPAVTFANLNWVLESKVEHVASRSMYFLGFYLSCDPVDGTSLWSGEVDVVICLRSQREGTENLVRSSSMTINFYSRQCSFPCFVEFSKVEHYDGLYVKDGKLEVDARIVLKKTLVKHERTFDFTLSADNYTDGVLVIEGVRLYIVKKYLALYSPVFAAMFCGDFRERQMDEVPLEDVKTDEFVEFLQVIYPSHKPVNAKNVEFLLKLGDRFDTQFVMKSCEAYLISTKDLTTSAKLLLGDTYQLSALQRACVDSLTSTPDISSLTKSNEYRYLGNTTRDALLERFANLLC